MTRDDDIARRGLLLLEEDACWISCPEPEWPGWRGTTPVPRPHVLLLEATHVIGRRLPEVGGVEVVAAEADEPRDDR